MSMLLFSAPERLYTLRVPCVVFVNTALTRNTNAAKTLDDRGEEGRTL